MKSRDDIIKEIRLLVSEQGYLYALLMILFDDFHLIAEEMHDIDFKSRISTREAALLLGFLLQTPINFEKPSSPEILFTLKTSTYDILRELHDSFHSEFVQKLISEHESVESGAPPLSKRDFFMDSSLTTEPIFYSSTGAYDFQYLEYLEYKYLYDLEWLNDNYGFEPKAVRKTTSKIKELLEEKSKVVELVSLTEKWPSLKEIIQRENPDVTKEDLERHKTLIEMYQYKNLFGKSFDPEQSDNSDEFYKIGWDSFYNGLIDLFILTPNDFDEPDNFRSLAANFSFSTGKGVNSQFNSIGDYNILNSHPIVDLGSERYFIPVTFLLHKSVYESPFYWMISDKSYLDTASDNRGRAGEEMVYNMLSKVFGTDHTWKSITPFSQKGQDYTDIDVLCIIRDFAIAVQVKSKKLTQLARKGNDEALKNDFQKAIQDAYQQGLTARKALLSKCTKFRLKNGKSFEIQQNISEVYILVVTTEDYPSLTHQASTFLEKPDGEPFPLVVSIFDIELLAHYLTNVYDFFYYLRQRINHMGYFAGDDEMAFLGYHLHQKLWFNPEANMILIDNHFAAMIDRNYFPYKAGIDVSDETDVLQHGWKNEDFNTACSDLAQLLDENIILIMFVLLDLSGKARDGLIENIQQATRQRSFDGRSHNFTLPPDPSYHDSIGISFISSSSANMDELENELREYAILRKYKSRANKWVAVGNATGTSHLIDKAIFLEENWTYNDVLALKSRKYLKPNPVPVIKKVGRNSPCPCGSGIKYKKCCGR